MALQRLTQQLITEGCGQRKISLQNLGIDTIDVHYIHIPEITCAKLTKEEFYERIANFFAWYENKVKEGKIRFYGLALEMLAMEPEEEKWYINIEKVEQIAREISKENSHIEERSAHWSKRHTEWD